MHISLQIALAAFVGSLSTLCVNFFTTKWRAKHEYMTHAQKIFFEKKLESYGLLIRHIQVIYDEYAVINSLGLENAWRNEDFKKRFLQKCFELNKYMELNSLFMPKELSKNVDQFFRYSNNIDPIYDDAWIREHPEAEPPSIIRRRKVRQMIDNIQNSIAKDMQEIGLKVDVYLVREPPPKP